jgi:hypothetical protein
MRLKLRKESNFWLIKRQNDSVPGLVILIALTTMSLIPLPSTFPNNVDIRHSASLIQLWYPRQPENFSGRNLAQWPTVYPPNWG